MTKNEAKELIKKRRDQILIHSCIYYELNESLITDNQWATWAKELVKLQTKYPDIAKNLPWAEAFENFDASTGYNLPLRDPWVFGRAVYVLNYAKMKMEE